MSTQYEHCRNLDFLFVSYGGGHIASVLPVVHSLIKQGYQVGIFALTTATGVLKDKSLRWFSYQHLPQFTNKARELGLAIQDKVESNVLVELEESIAYMGINLHELIVQYGEKEAFARYADMGRRAFLPVELMKAVLTDLSPNVLISTNSPRTEHASFLAAEALGIPSLALIDQFGVLDVERMSRSGYGTLVCVLNDAVKRELISRGRPEHEVVVTGNPAFDVLRAVNYIEKGKTIRRERVRSELDLVVLWCSQNEPPPGDPTLPVQIEQILRRLIQQSPQMHLVIRYHPSQKIHFEPQSRTYLSGVDDALEPDLHAADVVITRNSTVGLQALSIGKTLLVADFGRPRLGVSFSKLGLAPSIQNEFEMKRELDLCLLAKCESSGFREPEIKSANPSATDAITGLLRGLMSSRIG